MNDIIDDGELSQMICYRCQESAIIYWEFPKTVIISESKALSLLQQKVLASAESSIYDDDSRGYNFMLDETSIQDETMDETMMGTFEQLNDLATFEITDCGICGVLLNNELEYSEHQRCHGRESIENTFSCEDCGEDFNTSELLQNHSAEHCVDVEPQELFHQPAEAPSIDKRAKRMKSYMLDDQGRYVCNICDSTFKSKDNLNRHIVKHDGTKDFKCIYCPREFYFQRDLNVHLKQSHFESKKVVCGVCDADFTTNSALKKHFIAKHMGMARKFDCDKCKLIFKTKGALNIHQRTHTKEKPFKCEICSSAFSQKVILQRHMKNIHNENIYECEWCKETFEKQLHLREHWTECTNLRNRCSYEEIFVSHAGIEEDKRIKLIPTLS